jgi:hypothetical protein
VPVCVGCVGLLDGFETPYSEPPVRPLETLVPVAASAVLTEVSGGFAEPLQANYWDSTLNRLPLPPQMPLNDL